MKNETGKKILKLLERFGFSGKEWSKCSSEELDEAINRLSEARNDAKKREENERREKEAASRKEYEMREANRKEEARRKAEEQRKAEEERKVKEAEAEKRKSFREYLHSAVSGYVLQPTEKALVNYRGFEIVLPANMVKEKPYIWLCGEGRYYVELGETDIGNMTRIDNCLETLEKHLEKLNAGLEKLLIKESGIKSELAKDENYNEQINRYKAEVERLDNELKVG